MHQLAYAEAKSREKSQLLASIAHDLRSPIISLLGMLELVEDKQFRGATTISARRSAETLLALVDDILELAFLGSGQFRLSPSTVDLRQLAEDVIDGMRQNAASKGLALELKVSGTLPAAVEVDRLRLEQVLTNLLTNAIKYTVTGSVTLHLDVGEHRSGAVAVSFKVIDTGIGISPTCIDQVFGEFGRLDVESVSREPGTGLGLPICQRILSTMGSKLSLESTPGVGSTFSFQLLLPKQEGGTAEDPDRPLAGLTIVLAEDEPVIRRATARRLVEAGASIVEASDGVETLAILERRAADMLLLDLQMPVLGGVDVIRRLQAGDATFAFPVFILTARISGPEVAEALAVGVDAVLTKPLQVSALVAAFNAKHGTIAEQLIEVADFYDVIDHADVAGASELVTEFERSLREDLFELQALIDNKEMGKAKSLAHRCTGICQVMGASAIAQIFADIEQTTAEGDAAAARSLVRAADEVLTLTLDIMWRYVSKNHGEIHRA